MSEGLSAGDMDRADWGMSEEVQIALEQDIAKGDQKIMLPQLPERNGQLDLLFEEKKLKMLSRAAIQQEISPQFS